MELLSPEVDLDLRKRLKLFIYVGLFLHLAREYTLIHSMGAEDIYEEHISTAFLCQAIGKMTSTDNKQKLD
jgi:hypothetical protein